MTTEFDEALSGFDAYLREVDEQLKGEHLDKLRGNSKLTRALIADGMKKTRAHMISNGAKSLYVPVADVDTADRLADRLGLRGQLAAISVALRFLERELVLHERWVRTGRRGPRAR